MSDITGMKKVPVELGGVTFWFSSLTDESIGELTAYVRAEYIKLRKATMDTGLSVADREKELDHIYEKAMGIFAISGQGAKYLASVDGMCLMMWHALKNDHADWPLQRFKDHIAALGEAERARVIAMGNRGINSVNGLDKNPPGPAGPNAS